MIQVGLSLFINIVCLYLNASADTNGMLLREGTSACL